MKSSLNFRFPQTYCIVIILVIASHISVWGQLLPLPSVTLPSTCDTQSCSPQTDGYPSPYIYPGECHIGIERYLSRSIEMGFLADLNFNGNEPNCTPPHKFGEYCPTVYCEMIKKLHEMDAQFIRNVYQAGAYHEFEFFPGNPWYNLGYQVVRDINYAYDCAGKPRPIIQASAIDNGSLDNFSFLEVPDGIDRHIPTSLIVKYFSDDYYPEDKDDPDPDAPSTYDYYFNSSGTPKASLYFKKARLSGTDGGYSIDKVEMRMWFLYQCMILIDFGYSAIHMGLYTNYANDDVDSNYQHLYKLTNKIRQYAYENNKFVLLSGETPYPNEDNGQSAKLFGTDFLIFDFDSRAMRPREISSPQVNGDGVGCDDPISTDDFFLFSNPNSECYNEEFPAIVDPCTINSAGGTVGGYPPNLNGTGPNMGCHYEQVPYVVHYDGFSVPTNPGQPSPLTLDPNFPIVSSLTWGYNDHRWFSELSLDCQKKWFEYFYCDRRNYHGGHGYIPIPGIISAGHYEVTPPYSELVLYIDNPLFEEYISEALEPKMPGILITEICTYPNKCKVVCKGRYANAGKLWRTSPSYYKINVDNKDCSSVYSIHIKDPNGNWLQQEIGDTYTLYPLIAGTYQIGIRQDNLALDVNTYGTQIYDTLIYLYKECCFEQVPVFECHPLTEVWVNCLNEDTEKFEYEFEIEAGDLTSTFQNVRSLSDRCQVASIIYHPEGHRANGIAYIYDKQNPTLEFLVDYMDIEGLKEILIQEPLDSCTGGTILRENQNKLVDRRPISTFNIFPNPANDKIQIISHLIEDEMVEINVYDAVGRLIIMDKRRINKHDNLIEYDITHYPSGIYTIIVVGSLGTRSFDKFVKVKN